MEAITIFAKENGSRHIQLVHDYPIPEPSEGEALLKVILAGICGTDLEILAGYKALDHSFVIGHEFVGELVDFGPNCAATTLQVGCRVVAEINCVRKQCPSRNAAERAQDPSRTALGIFGRDGVFAEYVTVPLENLHSVPENITNESAVFAEPIAAACQIMEQMEIPGTSEVAVLGAGKLGWLVALVLSKCSKDVCILSRGRDRITDERRSKQFNVPVKFISDSDMTDYFDIVADCTGHCSGLEAAIKFVKPRGTIILKSTAALDSTRAVDLTPVVVKEVRIVGSRCGPFPVAIRMLANGLDPREMIDSVYPRSEYRNAIDRAQERGVLKVLLR